VKRVALHSVLKPGLEEGYDAAHARIPDDLVAAHRRVGIHDWQIWRSGSDLFHLVECDDFEEAVRALEHDPANERWQETIGPFVDHFERPAGGMELPLVWRMTDQAPEEAQPPSDV
jgi:L-rhamnose mutarotase